MSLYLDDVFDRVLGLPVGERDAALSELCRQHPSMEAEVRELLGTDAEAEEAEGLDELTPGMQLGPYRLAARLGEGATAAVWQAFDTHLHTWTALKLLRPELQQRLARNDTQSSYAVDAVLHEARAASRIISDHVVRIKAAGKLAEFHYIAMELAAEHRPDAEGAEQLVVGTTLGDVDLGGAAEVVRAVAEAARGVDAAHRVGVLHRDLKPQNILITPVSKRALVTDFGLAAPHLHAVAQPGASPTATVTVLLEDGGGKIVGTPCYMAPEQAFGHPPTRRCDVYALGATLYALLAGRAPYEEGESRSAISVVQAVRGGPPVPLGEVAPGTDPRLVRIVEKAMHRSTRERYATAAALADDLECYLCSRPTSVDTQRLTVLRLFLTRRRREVGAGLMVALLSLLFVGAVGALTVLWSTMSTLEGDIALAEQRLDAAHEAAIAAEAVWAQAERDKHDALRDLQQAERARRAAELGADYAGEQLRMEMKMRGEAERELKEASRAQRVTEDAHRASVEAVLRREAEVELVRWELDQLNEELREALVEKASLGASLTELREAQKVRAAEHAAELERLDGRRAELMDELAVELAARAQAEAELSALRARVAALAEP